METVRQEVGEEETTKLTNFMWGLDDDVLSIVQVASEKLVLAVVTYIESASAVFTSVMLFRISSPHLPATAVISLDWKRCCCWIRVRCETDYSARR